MIAIDTNILVYAHRPECPSHAAARAAIADLATSVQSWGIPLHCLVELTAVLTNPRIWSTPSSPAQITRQVDAWLECPRAHVLTEDRDWWGTFCATVANARAQGGQVHDARIAATCRYHGVSVLWSADRDFSRYPWLATHNPLLG